ncbi:MAG: SRPBCC domain-containing protein [Leptospirales bacterium]
MGNQVKKIKFTVTTILSATPEQVYNSWLSTTGHSRMTGAESKANKKINGLFSAWDGYISGINIELEDNKRILQKWRTSEFKQTEEDSLLEIILVEDAQGTKLTLYHSNLPANGMQYQQGWQDNYFTPMNEYFAE